MTRTVTPEQIAMTLYTSGTFHSPIVADGDLMRDVMVAGINADRAQRIEVGARVVNILNPELDSRRVIAVGDGWVWLDFQQWKLDAGEAPARLPIANYRRIA